QRLEHQIVRWGTIAAVRIGRRTVGGHHGEVVGRRLDAVVAGEGGQRLGGGNGAVAFGARALVIDQVNAKTGDGAVRFNCQRRVVVAIPGLSAARKKVFHAVFNVFHRASVRLARQQGGDVGATRPALATEAAALGVGD